MKTVVFLLTFLLYMIQGMYNNVTDYNMNINLCQCTCVHLQLGSIEKGLRQSNNTFIIVNKIVSCTF